MTIELSDRDYAHMLDTLNIVIQYAGPDQSKSVLDLYVRIVASASFDLHPTTQPTRRVRV